VKFVDQKALRNLEKDNILLLSLGFVIRRNGEGEAEDFRLSRVVSFALWWRIMALKFNCTACGKEIIVRYLKVGEVAKCRNCWADVPVPGTAIETGEKPVYVREVLPEPPRTVEPEDLECLAGRVDRLGAYLVDQLILLVPVPGILFGAIHPALFAWPILGLLSLFAIQAVMLTFDGQTIGKKIAKIKVVKIETGRSGGFVTNVLVREVVNFILRFLPLYELVDRLFIFRRDRRCVHDLIAGTKVVWKR
jgi:uncharacterized RDD family membrane protein YckC/predicted RNA-binding Zn-ribbon protein involved in translation (DUF1610 family)